MHVRLFTSDFQNCENFSVHLAMHVRLQIIHLNLNMVKYQNHIRGIIAPTVNSILNVKSIYYLEIIIIRDNSATFNL